MLAANSEKTVLKMMWELVAANGRSPHIAISELVPQIEAFQQAGVSIYATRESAGIEDAVRDDIRMLERLGFIRFSGDAAELTGAGQLFASTLEYPRWAERRLHGEAAA
jgi:hypothetical protein